MQQTNQRQLGGENPDWLNHLEEALGDCLSLWGLIERAEARAEDTALGRTERQRARNERDEHQEAMRLRLCDVIHDATGAKSLLSIDTLRESRGWPKTERTHEGLRAMARMSLFAQAMAHGPPGHKETALSGETPSAA